MAQRTVDPARELGTGAVARRHGRLRCDVERAGSVEGVRGRGRKTICGWGRRTEEDSPEVQRLRPREDVMRAPGETTERWRMAGRRPASGRRGSRHSGGTARLGPEMEKTVRGSFAGSEGEETGGGAVGVPEATRGEGNGFPGEDDGRGGSFNGGNSGEDRRGGVTGGWRSESWVWRTQPRGGGKRLIDDGAGGGDLFGFEEGEGVVGKKMNGERGTGVS